MIEYIGWRVRLWLVGYRERVKDRNEELTWKYMGYGWPWRWLRDLVDTAISPFDQWSGYRRQPLRALLWKVSHPLPTMRLASLRWSIKLLNRVAPYVGAGKFEGSWPSERLQIEWLYRHTEEAFDVIGSIDEVGWVSWLFEDADVPWSRTPETWIVVEDQQGFVVGTGYVSPETARTIYERDRSLAMQQDIEEVYP